MANNEGLGGGEFGPVIYCYSRADAVADGVLIDVSAMAREAGFKWPVAMTAAVWEDCVAWSQDDSARQTPQDEEGRLWDVLCMAAHAIRTAPDAREQQSFVLLRVPRDERTTVAIFVTLKLWVGPGDDGEPVVTVLLPNED